LQFGLESRAVFRFLPRCVGESRLWRFKADAVHCLAKQLAVLRHVDGLGAGADQFDAVALQYAFAFEGQRGVERGLSAHRRQQRIGLFLLDDLGDKIGRDRFDIGRIGKVGIGHDGRGIGIDQDDPIALVFQRLAGLGAGIVEFARLADHDRAGADDQNRFDVCAFRHELSAWCVAGGLQPGTMFQKAKMPGAWYSMWCGVASGKSRPDCCR